MWLKRGGQGAARETGLRDSDKHGAEGPRLLHQHSSDKEQGDREGASQANTHHEHARKDLPSDKEAMGEENMTPRLRLTERCSKLRTRCTGDLESCFEYIEECPHYIELDGGVI